MPFVNGKFYANPAYGRAVERARSAEESSRDATQQGDGGRWVTIAGHHVFIHDGQAERAKAGEKPPKVFSGEATYYDLPRAKTASGQKFDPNKMTAAMTADKVKLGKTVTVTYTHLDKKGNPVTNSISVVVNDRGPFSRDANGKATMPLQPAPGRVIDLTPAAFSKLVGSTRLGHVHVTVTVPND